MNLTNEDFASVEAIDKVLERIGQTHGNFIADPETEEGRAQMRAVAAQVTARKTEILRYGKALRQPYWDEHKRIVAVCKHAESELNAMRDHIRKPADDWEREQREKAAVTLTPPPEVAEEMDKRVSAYARVLEELAAIGVNSGHLIVAAILDGRIKSLRIVEGES